MSSRNGSTLVPWSDTIAFNPSRYSERDCINSRSLVVAGAPAAFDPIFPNSPEPPVNPNIFCNTLGKSDIINTLKMTQMDLVNSLETPVRNPVCYRMNI